ncbi:MAG TPA: hypothetical protein VMW25_01225, partial [Clostridia bacterium]|nr:hypothetical protein [Clostridia bacterium]
SPFSSSTFVFPQRLHVQKAVFTFLTIQARLLFAFGGYAGFVYCGFAEFAVVYGYGVFVFFQEPACEPVAIFKN